MTRLNRTAFFLTLLSTSLLACGGDDGDGDGGADASVDGGGDAAVYACAEFTTPAGTISSFPGSFDGDVLGAGADLDVAAGVCADERSHFPQAGEDQVVQLTGLTPGAAYVVSITAAADISFYIATSCEAAGPVADQCLLFVDEAVGGAETGDFVAPDSGVVFVTIDQYDEVPPVDGSYTLDVFEAECSEDSECTEPGLGVCSNRTCVQCASPTDCTSEGAPVCDLASNTCVAGFALCTGDDPSPPENADDGTVGATDITPVEGAPATVDANICSLPAAEADFYVFTVDEPGNRVISVGWADQAADIDLYVLDAEGGVVETSFDSNPEVLNLPLEAGTYYALVNQFAPADTAAAVPYTITASIPECTSSFECPLSTAPVCSPLGECVAGPDECTGDDLVAESAGDDGPAGATDVTPLLGDSTTTNSQICNTPEAEKDFYQVAVADGDNLDITVTWAEATADLDLYLYDATGKFYGLTYHSSPEVVSVSNLAAGTYYFEVQAFAGNGAPALDYTVTVDRSAGGCTVDADCDDVFETQLFRGSCDVGTGACNAIEGAGAVAAGGSCDSPDDCSGGACSYSLFQSNAAASVCTVDCTADADCTAALGEGYSCSTGFETNVCLASCTVDTDCGVDVSSDTLDADLPWDYHVCTVASGSCGPE